MASRNRDKGVRASMAKDPRPPNAVETVRRIIAGVPMDPPPKPTAGSEISKGQAAIETMRQERRLTREKMERAASL